MADLYNGLVILGILVDTDYLRFESWLTQYIGPRYFNQPNVPTLLDPFTFYEVQDPIVVEHENNFVHKLSIQAKESRYRSLPDRQTVVLLEVTEITSDRIEINLRCPNTAFASFCVDLLKEIVRLYPESTSTVNNRLLPFLTEIDRHDTNAEQVTQVLATAPKPWELVEDKGYNRALVELLHDPSDFTTSQICKLLSKRYGFVLLTESTIDSRISALRKEYGSEIVPHRRRGRKSL